MKYFTSSTSTLAGTIAGYVTYGSAMKAAVGQLGFWGKIGYSLGLISPPFAAVALPVAAAAVGTASVVALGLTLGKKVMELTDLAEREGFVDGPVSPQADAAEKRRAEEARMIVPVP